jgi:hypothetical protein
MHWHLPYESRSSDDRELEEMPRYQFVTNFYQGFGLSFVALLSSDVPSELTDEQLASLNSLNHQFLGQQQQIGNTLLPQYQSILNNPGLSPADKAAVTGQSQGSLASAFDSLQQSAQNRLWRARAIPQASANSPTNWPARRELRSPARPSRINSPSPTPPSSARWPRYKDFPDSSAWILISSAALSASPRNSSTFATTPRAPLATAFSPRSAPALAPH